MLTRALCALEGVLSRFSCISCGNRTGSRILCPGCESRLRFVVGCPRCGAHLRDPSTGSGRCCMHSWLPYSTFTAPLEYRSPATEVIRALKWYGSYRALAFCAEHLVRALPGMARRPAVVCWVPSASVDRKGFDHGEFLAWAVGQALGVPTARLVRRSDRRELKGLGRAGRLEVAGSMFEAASSSPPTPVLLVDDITTTGASFYFAASVLLEAGAREVHAAAVARRAQSGHMASLEQGRGQKPNFRPIGLHPKS